MMLMLMIITLLLMMAMARMAAVAPLLPLVPVLLGMLMMARWLVDQTACTEIHLEGRFAFEDRRQQLPACSAQVHLRSGTHTGRRTTSQTQPSTMTCPQCQHLLLLKVTQQMCCRTFQQRTMTSQLIRQTAAEAIRMTLKTALNTATPPPPPEHMSGDKQEL